ncbi:MAG: HD-GYP domain-containing protein [bacterium]
MIDDGALKRARILIVDDQEANVRLLERILRRVGYANVRGTTDPRDVPGLVGDHPPDLILLDLVMPHLDGHQVMARLEDHRQAAGYLPILVLTADITAEAKQRALSGGAKDFLTKPFDATEVLLRIRNLLEARFLYQQLQRQNVVLEEKVVERTHDLEEARIEILDRLARAAEYRDDDTGQHTQRVGRLSADVAGVLGLPGAHMEMLRRAAPLHDVGKIGIPDRILLKPGRLTPQEFEVMKTHTTIGAGILAGSRVPLLQLAAEIALTHHERWDGGGFPLGLEGNRILLEARIVSAADAYDAMASDRPYRKALPQEDVWELLWGGAGSQWDADIVEALTVALERTTEEVVAHGDGAATGRRRQVAADPRR